MTGRHIGARAETWIKTKDTFRYMTGRQIGARADTWVKTEDTSRYMDVSAVMVIRTGRLNFEPLLIRPITSEKFDKTNANTWECGKGKEWRWDMVWTANVKRGIEKADRIMQRDKTCMWKTKWSQHQLQQEITARGCWNTGQGKLRCQWVIGKWWSLTNSWISLMGLRTI